MAVTFRHVDKVAGLLFLGLAAAIYTVSGGLPEGTGRAPGAGFFPRVIAACIAVLSVVQVAQSVTRSDERVHRITVPVAKRILVTVVLLAAYVATLPVLGFLLGTVVFLLVFLRYSGVESLRVSLPFGLAVAVVLQYVFGSFLHVPLPDGVVPLADLLPRLPLLLGGVA